MRSTEFDLNRRAALGLGLGTLVGVALPSTQPERAFAASGPGVATSIVIGPENYPGADPTGVSDSTAAIQQAIVDCPDGGIVTVPPGRYRIAGTLTNNGKNLSLHGQSAVLVKSSAGRVFQLNGAYDDALGVAEVEDVRLTYAERDQLGIRLSLGVSPSWSTGDIVKLVADDVIAGSRPGAGSEQSRVGQYFTVHRVAGNTAELLGRKRATFSQNIRVARMNKIRVRISGFTVTSDSDGFTNSEVCTFSGLYMPEVHDVSIESAGGPAIVFRGCFAYTATNVDVSFALDEPASGSYGYGILDNASAHGRIQGLRALKVRHAYTDDTSRVEANSGVVHYGSTSGTLISDSVCQGATTAAWDTHSCSEYVVFDRCVAFDSYRAFNLRGRKHTIRSCAAYGGANGVRLTSEGSAEDDSWGHIVEDFIADGILEGAVIVDPFLDGGRELRRSRLSRIVVRNSAAPQVLLSNAVVVLDNLILEVTQSLAPGAVLIRSTNAEVTGREWLVDLRHSPQYSDLTLISARKDGSFFLDDSVVDWSTAGASAIRTLIVSDRTVNVQCQGTRLPTRHPNPSTDLLVGSSFVWTAASDHSGFIERIDSAIATASAAGVISRSTDRVLFVNCRTGSARNFADLLPGALLGQLLVISNSETSTGRVTVRHGVDRNTLLNGGVNQSLEPGQSISLMWSGTIWRQV